MDSNEQYVREKWEHLDDYRHNGKPVYNLCPMPVGLTVVLEPSKEQRILAARQAALDELRKGWRG